jgi:hypothetical protein
MIAIQADLLAVGEKRIINFTEHWKMSVETKFTCQQYGEYNVSCHFALDAKSVSSVIT